jgi:pimeloyl-ACP methyl ester carboxylesterase
MLRLARWLGPWTPATQAPTDDEVVREERVLAPSREGERPMRVWAYRPAKGASHGSLLLLHGLHYLGPSDPRMDRFSRILAASGALVWAPFIPDFERLVLAPTVFRDCERALDALLAYDRRPPDRAPGVMSISFGSLPALHLASNREHSFKLSSLVLFGGYADLGDTMRFALEGEPGRLHDPYNRPVVFMNLVDHLGEALPQDRSPLMEAWRAYIDRTWGRPQLKSDPAAGEAIAREFADKLDPVWRSVFLRTAGVEPGMMDVFETAWARGRDRLAWLDPTEKMRSVRVPTYVLHGADDDVIPHRHARMFERQLPREHLRGVHVTGLYGHTGAAAPPWKSARQIVGEVATMIGALRAIDRASRG